MILRLTLLLIVIGISYLSLTPTETITIGNDKISHFIAYSILTINIGMIYFENKKRFSLGVVLAIILGIVIEGIQYYVPGRFMSFYDIMANVSGVFIGALIELFFHKQIINLLKKTRII